MAVALLPRNASVEAAAQPDFLPASYRFLLLLENGEVMGRGAVDVAGGVTAVVVPKLRIPPPPYPRKLTTHGPRE